MNANEEVRPKTKFVSAGTCKEQLAHSIANASPEQTDYFFDLEAAVRAQYHTLKESKIKLQLPKDGVGAIFREWSAPAPGSPIEDRIQHDLETMNAMQVYHFESRYRRRSHFLKLTETYISNTLKQYDREAESHYKAKTTSERIIESTGNITKVDFGA